MIARRGSGPEGRYGPLAGEELDVALGSPSASLPSSNSALYSTLKSLPYLLAVIEEGLRISSVVGANMPRVVPPGGMDILGHSLKEGTVVSVPLYTLHRDKKVWGEDAEEFKVERWLGADGEKEKEKRESTHKG